ncbi:MAG TPA: chemotaxis response regulator protein-glutamate methylesterase [Bacilli bacterium]
MHKRYSVMVVDDSAFMRKMISDLINEDPQFTVICTAFNGKDALEKLRLHRPDCITMDIEMPEMDGLQTLKHIMQNDPIPVLMLSGKTGPGAKATILALEAGAIDFVLKPSGAISLDIHHIRKTLIDKLHVCVRTKLKWQPPITNSPLAVLNAEAAPKQNKKMFSQLVAIGTSTGGPKALQNVVARLPKDFPAPILIVQHMPPNFTRSLAQRLDQLAQIRVKEAVHGEELKAGVAYIAPGGMHMRLTKSGAKTYTIALGDDDPVNGHRPSVDELFTSLVPYTDLIRHAILMTGMGSDGAKGMKALRDSGAVTTIAEAEQTAIVYGMPRAAIELQCVTDIVPLEFIAATLVKKVSKMERHDGDL